jgi:hypothetical protein
MRSRQTWLHLAAMAAMVSALLCACSGPDPAAIEFRDRTPINGGPPIGSSGGSSGGVAGDAGATGGGEGGAGDGAAAGDPVVGAMPYAAAPPTGNKHNGGGQAPNPLINTTDCMSCHAGGGPKKFLTGGVVYQTKAANTKAANVEVWITDGATKFKVNTDTDGAFWFVPGAGGAPATLPAAAKTSIRGSDGKIVPMGNLGVGGKGCNDGACHANANPGKIFLQ